MATCPGCKLSQLNHEGSTEDGEWVRDYYLCPSCAKVYLEERVPELKEIQPIMD